MHQAADRVLKRKEKTDEKKGEENNSNTSGGIHGFRGKRMRKKSEKYAG